MIIKYLSFLILVFICLIIIYNENDQMLAKFYPVHRKETIALQNNLSSLKFQSYRFANVTAHDWKLTDSN